MHLSWTLRQRRGQSNAPRLLKSLQQPIRSEKILRPRQYSKPLVSSVQRYFLAHVPWTRMLVSGGQVGQGVAHATLFVTCRASHQANAEVTGACCLFARNLKSDVVHMC